VVDVDDVVVEEFFFPLQNAALDILYACWALIVVFACAGHGYRE
jgi:hypothetical protein